MWAKEWLMKFLKKSFFMSMSYDDIGEQAMMKLEIKTSVEYAVRKFQCSWIIDDMGNKHNDFSV